LTEPRWRPADTSDGPRLRAVAEAAKRHWGHDQERVRSWAAALDLSREIWVAENDDDVVAWAALLPPTDGICELDDLWVEPRAMGLGIGTALFHQAAARARELGAHGLRWEAERNAVGFYERMGAETVGTATSFWGRTLPVMRVRL
jgi:GNAT superfamily N-acetyltransferase